MSKGKRPPKPRTGPYGVAVWDAGRGAWVRRLTDAGRAMVEDYLARYTIPALIRSQWPGLWAAVEIAGVPQEDLIAAAAVGAARAGVLYTEAGGAAFDTYASTWVRSAVLQQLKDWKYQTTIRTEAGDTRRTVTLTADPADGSLPWDWLADYREPDRSRVDEADDAAFDAHHLLARMPERNRKVCELVYGIDPAGPVSFAEAGRQLGVTRERVRQLVLDGFRMALDGRPERADRLKECVRCGREIPYLPGRGGVPAKVCSRECRRLLGVDRLRAWKAGTRLQGV